MGQVIAIGGGGVSMEGYKIEPERIALDWYILAQTSKTRPKVCFLPTASGDSDLYIKNFYVTYATLDCQPTHLSLFRQSNEQDLESLILQQDVIYVGGGNTRNLMVIWREWGLDVILQKAFANGILLAGVSAGAICWFEQGCTDSAGTLGPMNCLGIVPGSCCPHYDSQIERRPAFQRMVADGTLQAGYAADDNAALHFVDGQLKKSVCSLQGKQTFRVENSNGLINELPLQTEYIGP